MQYERTNEHKQRMSDATKKAWTPERREAMRQFKLANNPVRGTKRSLKLRREHSQRMSGEGNSFFGKQHSPETIAKLSSERIGITYRLRKYGITPEQYKEKLESGFMWCSYAKHFALAEEFTTRWGHTSKAGRCKRCIWVAMLKVEYGVTPEWYEAKMAEQGGGCALCGKQFDLHRGNQRRNLCIDHDHTTGANRGILCHKCNSSIERLEAIADWADKALAYLKSYAQAA